MDNFKVRNTFSNTCKRKINRCFTFNNLQEKLILSVYFEFIFFIKFSRMVNMYITKQMLKFL